jgi:hypothetical protein
MKTHQSRLLLLLVTSLALGAPLASAADAPAVKFPDPSPKSTLEQSVGATTIKIEYYRPGVKGRKIFGGLEPWGEVWRTGANNPTKVTFSTAVKFGGTDVPAGSYGLYSLLGENEWTVILNKIGEKDWGAYAYNAANDAARVKVKPSKLSDVVETFTIDLNDIKTDSAMLNLMWEKTKVSVKIEVDLKDLKAQVAQVMGAPGDKNPNLLFGAAMFNFETGGDLKQASMWMNEGLSKQPNAFWFIYRKGLILEKMGDKAGAKAAAEASKKVVAEAKGQPQSLIDEYNRLNDALIARVK